MCGIFALLNHNSVLDPQIVSSAFYEGKSRGPEFSTLEQVSIDCQFGFHRLAINGLDSSSNQPIRVHDCVLICNGEIYNYKELYNFLQVTPTTNSDCEIIIHLYKKFGIEYTLKVLDGVFAFLLLDNSVNNTKLFAARDPYGVRPLYMFNETVFNVTGFASTMAMLQPIINVYSSCKITHLKPGSYNTYVLPYKASPQWLLESSKKYFTLGFSTIMSYNDSFDNILKNIRNKLISAVYKRCNTSDRPIACLLSGGLDSSLITALVCKYFKEKNLSPIETYSIGMPGSEDIKKAELVADFLGTKHTSIIISKEDFVNAIPEVIEHIESYDTTTVRASIGNYLVAKHISKNSDAKVIFSGEGSDELTGGYLYINHAPTCLDFDNECKRLMEDIYMYDVTRCDKSISCHGLEPRTPFLDRAFTQYYFSIPMNIRYEGGRNSYFNKYKSCEKYLLRAAFDPDYTNEKILPDDILWRTKEAFSDGVSSYKESTLDVLNKHIESIHMEEVLYDHNTPKTKEQMYYRNIFEKKFKDQGEIIPYFWMPKFVESNDPSARTLSIYSEYNYDVHERSL